MAIALFLLCLLPFAFSQSVCKDDSSQCPSFQQQGLCNDQIVKDCMVRECRLSCGICQPPTTAPACDDVPGYKRNCPGWAKLNYCKQKYVDFMKKNCKRSCGLCGGGPVTSSPPVTTVGPRTQPPSGKMEFPCAFETDHCDWVNEPLEDDADWSIGTSSNGPSSGAGGSSNYAFVDSSTSGNKARLFLPLELVLPSGVTNKGSMCLKFQYVLSGGSMRVIDQPYPTTNNKNPAERTVSTLSSASSWTETKVQVNVDNGRKLIIEGVHGGSGTIAIDELGFVSGRC